MTQIGSIDYQWMFRGVVERVIDGDTIVVSLDLGFHIHVSVHIRMDGYNAPEIRGEEKEEGARYKLLLETLLNKGEEVIIKTDKDRSFNRWIGLVFKGTTCINQVMEDAINGKDEGTSNE